MSAAEPKPKAYLNRRYRFSASHRLHVEALGEEGNRTMFGKCNNPHGHGHNYIVQVTMEGVVDEATGMVVNLGDLDEFAQRELVEPLHLSNLNAHPAFQECVPSTENLCSFLWPMFASFAADYPALTLTRVRVEETNNNAFDYFGEGQPDLSPAPLRTGEAAREIQP